MHGELKIFCGSSNAALGAAMAKSAGSILGEINLKRFSSGEIYAQFLEDVRGRDVFLLQTCVEPVNDNLMELLIMIDAAKRSSAERITVIMPNYFYARQDRKTASRESITAKLVADMITAAGADRVLCIDLHSDQLQGFLTFRLITCPEGKFSLKKHGSYLKVMSAWLFPLMPALRSTPLASLLRLTQGLRLLTRAVRSTTHAFPRI